MLFYKSNEDEDNLFTWTPDVVFVNCLFYVNIIYRFGCLACHNFVSLITVVYMHVNMFVLQLQNCVQALLDVLQIYQQIIYEKWTSYCYNENMNNKKYHIVKIISRNFSSLMVLAILHLFQLRFFTHCTGRLIWVEL